MQGGVLVSILTWDEPVGLLIEAHSVLQNYHTPKSKIYSTTLMLQVSQDQEFCTDYLRENIGSYRSTPLFCYKVSKPVKIKYPWREGMYINLKNPFLYKVHI